MSRVSRLTPDETEQLAEAFDDYHHHKYSGTHPFVEDRLTNSDNNGSARKLALVNVEQ